MRSVRSLFTFLFVLCLSIPRLTYAQDLPANSSTVLTVPPRSSAPIAASLTNDIVVPVTQTSAYRWVSITLSGTWSGTVTFYTSVDCNTYVPIALISAGAVTGPPATTAVTNDVYSGPLNGLCFKAVLTTGTSGTVNSRTLFFPAAGGSLAEATPSSQQCTAPVLTGFTLSPVGNPWMGDPMGTSSLSPYSVVAGSNALVSVAGEVYSVAVGSGSMMDTTTGAQNTTVGFEALQLNTTGAQNTALGFKALQSALTVNGQTAVGNIALQTSTGAHNTAVGNAAMSTNTTGTDNTCTGEFCISANDTGSFNAANGAFTLYTNVGGSYNTAEGAGALQMNTAGSGSTAVGFDALHNATTGQRNQAFGYQAGSAITTGTDNTLLGYDVASTTLTTGARNLVLGVSVDCDTAASSDSDTFRLCGADPTPILGAIKTNTAAPTFKLKGSLINIGTTFTLSGACGSDTPVGGSQAGTFVARTSGSCVTTVTVAGASVATAPNGWSCWVSNQTTANLIRQTGSSTTTATFTGVTVSGDVISFGCLGY